MNEFKNRILAQREVIRIVNSFNWREESLYGLSHNAIKRWGDINGLESNSVIISTLIEISGNLLMLASHSQTQITEEYNNKVNDITSLLEKLKNIIHDVKLKTGKKS